VLGADFPPRGRNLPHRMHRARSRTPRPTPERRILLLAQPLPSFPATEGGPVARGNSGGRMAEGSSVGVAVERSMHFSSPATNCGCVQMGEGIDLHELAAGTVLNVTTRNTCYRFVVVDGRRGQVVVQGGSWFPVETLARVDGAGARGRLPRPAWIGVSLHLEIAFGQDQRIVTSRVCSIQLVLPPSVS
jgi:hypothetical protein